ncbi:MAG TPA: DUF3310 domain-containing protein [Methanothrix sp.]|nr:DUF3310 domain-containing protein [Methanothrix sp.]HOL44531.1 DUF3310 domain-containing protein [Methanothrix sp.]
MSRDVWETVKRRGSEHYKTGDVEPLDLFRSGGILHHFAIASIIKYAFRQRKTISASDCEKIIHYAEILMALVNDTKRRNDK